LMRCKGYFRRCRGASNRPAFRLSRRVNLDERHLSPKADQRRPASVRMEGRPSFARHSMLMLFVAARQSSRAEASVAVAPSVFSVRRDIAVLRL
jgi:hypothetical protein